MRKRSIHLGEIILNLYLPNNLDSKYMTSFYPLSIDYAKVFDCVNHNKLWKILKEMGIPDHLTCLLRNLYAGQEATTVALRIGHGTTDRFKIRKGVHQGFILSPYLFNFYEECCSVTQPCPTLCYPMNCSTLGLPVTHHLLKFAQVQVH